MKGRSTKKEESRLPDAKPVRKFLIWGLDNPALRGLLLVGLVGVVVSLLAPYQFNQSLPLAGSVSQRTIYATHGFDVIRNNPQYEELVQREEGKVLPAYSYQPSMGDSMANLLQSRFREARAVLQNHTQEVAELKAAYEGELQQCGGNR